jgi:pyruvate dehydrogenase E2 component (dihydrolipoamide acetyltransferase)
VQEIRVKEGDKIKVGQVIFTVDGAEGKASAESKRAEVGPTSVQQKPVQEKEAVASSPSVSTASAAASTTPASAVALPVSKAFGASEFKLPELGENISQGDLVRLMIAPGAKVSEGQPVMELETDKAVVEVP